MRILRPGCFIWTFDKYCIGQVIDIQEGQCTVRFFISINKSVDCVFNAECLEVAYLYPQTRAYVREEDGNWIVGRVVDGFLEGDDVCYTIQFPNGSVIYSYEYDPNLLENPIIPDAERPQPEEPATETEESTTETP